MSIHFIETLWNIDSGGFTKCIHLSSRGSTVYFSTALNDDNKSPNKNYSGDTNNDVIQIA